MSNTPHLQYSRREFLRTSGIVSAAALAGIRVSGESAPQINVIETKVISFNPEHYHGWPTVVRRKNGQLLLSYSGGRESHICPFGRVEMMVSNDDGKTWGWPRVLLDTDMDDRDSGVLETSRGSLLVTTFTSLAYEPSLLAAEQKEPGDPKAWEPAKLKRWQAARNRLTAEQRKEQLGQWMIRSTDGGVTWSPRFSSIVNSPHGPVELADGRLLYAGLELWTGQHRVGVCESVDDGATWRWLAEIPARPGDNAAEYHELHAVETGGRIIVHIRNHNVTNAKETLQSESTDGGKTWSVPHAIGVSLGYPSHLLRLRNGNVLMTYGHRLAPFGNQGRMSKDGGRTWSEPMLISADGITGDLGYPSTVELADGTLLTVWYEAMVKSQPASLRQAKWKLPA